MKKETIKYENHPIPMVGRVWVFPEVRYIKDSEGEFGILGTELERLQQGVANAICGEIGSLNKVELEFLCELTGTSAKDIAELVQCNISSIVKWRQKDQVPALESMILKEYFWIKLFGEKVSFPKTQVGKERLEGLFNAAIKQKAVMVVRTKAA